MANLQINIGALSLQNPVMTASGTFGYGIEFADLVDITRLGGIFVKGTTLEPRQGNPYPRMVETPKGMINCVGLQNKGVDYFASDIYPQLLPYIKEGGTHFIVNVSGSSVDDYAECARRVAALEHIPAIELNISCPNVREGGMEFGKVPSCAAEVVKAVRAAFPRTLIVKLSPNVTDITEIARAVEAEGADAVSLINTLMGTSINIERRCFNLSIGKGGLSGPAVKPVAVKLVCDVFNAVNIPIIGLGGIMNVHDAIEFFMAGASAIQVGTANFIDPTISERLISDIDAWLNAHGISDIKEIIGAVHKS